MNQKYQRQQKISSTLNRRFLFQRGIFAKKLLTRCEDLFSVFISAQEENTDGRKDGKDDKQTEREKKTEKDITDRRIYTLTEKIERQQHTDRDQRRMTQYKERKSRTREKE